MGMEWVILLMQQWTIYIMEFKVNIDMNYMCSHITARNHIYGQILAVVSNNNCDLGTYIVAMKSHRRLIHAS